MESQGIAIPFFSEAQWAVARTVMEDGDTFHDSYAAFVRRVQQAEVGLRAQGYPTIRIHIDPHVFAQWCRANGRKVDAKSRSDYAALIAAKGDRAGQRR